MTFSPEAFNDLLDWLDPDREAAGQKYEIIRTGLIRILVSLGCDDAEDLADQTIDRVIAKLPAIRPSYVGEPAYYFRGVARNIAKEAKRRKEIPRDDIPERPSAIVATSDRYDCLIKCLNKISHDKRELILDYYLYEGRDKVEHHRRMAGELGLTDGALRTRAHHIRSDLEKCVLRCTKGLGKEQKPGWNALFKRRQMSTAMGKEHQP